MTAFSEMDPYFMLMDSYNPLVTKPFWLNRMIFACDCIHMDTEHSKIPSCREKLLFLLMIWKSNLLRKILIIGKGKINKKNTYDV